jgi:hypothetical protein
MALPLAAALLPIAGATIGGITGYRRSGGNIGAAALGAGLGATVPATFRMAGTALGGLGASALARAGVSGPALAKMGARFGGGAAGLGLFAVPGMAGSPAAALAGPVGGAAQLGLGAAGYQTPGAPDYAAYAGGALPPGLGEFGPGGTLSNPASVLGSTGMAQRAETLKTAEAQRDAMRMMMPEIARASEFRSRQELQRQLTAAGVRQNISTAANMLERSQQAAQQMGLNAASQAGSALTQQYQYQ